MLAYALAAILLANETPAPSTSAAPLPDATVAPLRCVRPVRCLTAAETPIGTPVKIHIWSLTQPTGGLQLRNWFFVSAEDVVVNGRLIIEKGGRGGPLGMGHFLAFGSGCSTDTLAADFAITQDFQYLPVSFGDPRTRDPNVLVVPMPHDAVCNNGGVDATVYISGAPSLERP